MKLNVNSLFINALAKFVTDEVTNFTGHSVVSGAAPDQASESLREHLEHRLTAFFTDAMIKGEEE